MIICKKCGEGFKKRVGLNIHIGKKHKYTNRFIRTVERTYRGFVKSSYTKYLKQSLPTEEIKGKIVNSLMEEIQKDNRFTAYVQDHPDLVRWCLSIVVNLILRSVSSGLA